MVYNRYVEQIKIFCSETLLTSSFVRSGVIAASRANPTFVLFWNLMWRQSNCNTRAPRPHHVSMVLLIPTTVVFREECSPVVRGVHTEHWRWDWRGGWPFSLHEFAIVKSGEWKLQQCVVIIWAGSVLSMPVGSTVCVPLMVANCFSPHADVSLNLFRDFVPILW